MAERKQYQFAPFVRMIKLTVKHKELPKVDSICCQLKSAIQASNIKYIELTGPFAPVIDRVRGEWVKCFYLKLSRDRNLTANKQTLLEAIENIKGGNRFITADVDPL